MCPLTVPTALATYRLTLGDALIAGSLRLSLRFKFKFTGTGPGKLQLFTGMKVGNYHHDQRL